MIKTELKEIGPAFYLQYPVTLKGGKYITIGNNFSTRARLRIEAWDEYQGDKYQPKIKIGDNVNINFDCHIGAINYIEIGDNVLIGSKVLITDHSHGEVSANNLLTAASQRPLFSKGPVIIEKNVWIGEGAAILAGVRVGENSIIGANAVVTSDVPNNCVIGGIPARILKQF
ncbi:acyltransferase [Mucilaginibacter sp.]|uniref:acyltransferase n=1 Tax=Mucilaginibacter sp. TaxID=1882438 RepID=UPI0025F2E2C1|nr:acyltransferase [Mucilaginibacter sp.]